MPTMKNAGSVRKSHASDSNRVGQTGSGRCVQRFTTFKPSHAVPRILARNATTVPQETFSAPCLVGGGDGSLPWSGLCRTCGFGKVQYRLAGIKTIARRMRFVCHRRTTVCGSQATRTSSAGNPQHSRTPADDYVNTSCVAPLRNGLTVRRIAVREHEGSRAGSAPVRLAPGASR